MNEEELDAAQDEINRQKFLEMLADPNSKLTQRVNFWLNSDPPSKIRYTEVKLHPDFTWEFA